MQSAVGLGTNNPQQATLTDYRELFSVVSDPFIAPVLDMGGRSLPYDYLVLATGVRHDYFSDGDWEPFAPGLKHFDDATAIRRRTGWAPSRIGPAVSS